MATDHFVNYCWEKKRMNWKSVTESDFGHDSVLLTSFSQIDNWATQVRPGRWLFSSFFSGLFDWQSGHKISPEQPVSFLLCSCLNIRLNTNGKTIEQKSGRILYFSNIDFFKVNKFPPVGAWLDLPGYQGYCSHNLEVETQSPFQNLIWHTGNLLSRYFKMSPCCLSAVLTGYYQVSYPPIVTVNKFEQYSGQWWMVESRIETLFLCCDSFKNVCYNNCFHAFIYLYFMFYSNTYWIVCLCHNNK